MKNELLTRDDCSAMRGIAILAIMLHNYCHFIGRIVQENEYQFFASNNDKLWQVLSNPDALLPVHLLSYFGHYGVPVFLFLSGYGLVMKYEKNLKIEKLKSGSLQSFNPSILTISLSETVTDADCGFHAVPVCRCGDSWPFPVSLGQRGSPTAHVYQHTASAR